MKKLIFEAYKKHLEEALAGAADDVDTQAKLDAELAQIGLGKIVTAADIVTIKEVDKGQDSVIVPIPAEMDDATTMTLGDFGEDSVVMDYATISVSDEIGKNLVWSRKYAESAPWSAMEVHLAFGRRAVEKAVFEDILAEFDAELTSGTLNAGTLDYDFLVEGMSKLDAKDYACEIVLCNPTDFATLLKDEKLTSALYVDPTQPVKTGTLSTILGFTIMKSSIVTEGQIYFLNKAAVTMARVRDITAEEYTRPESNKYGVVISCRFGLGPVLTDAGYIGLT